MRLGRALAAALVTAALMVSSPALARKGKGRRPAAAPTVAAPAVLGPAAAEPSVAAQSDAAPSGASPPVETQTRAYRESLEFERKADLERARETMIKVFGQRPTDYDAAIRLAWLSLSLGEADDAAEHYQRALLARPGDPTAAMGLDSALTLRSKQPVVSPSLWGSYMRKSTERLDWQGFSVATTLPLHIGPRYTVRAAYSFTTMELTHNLDSYPPVGERWRSTEAFLGIGTSRRRWGAELLGLVLVSSDLDPVYGGDARFWAGQTWGGVIEAAALGLAKGLNHQLSVTAFYVPKPGIVLVAGPRSTMDHEIRSVSAFGSVAFGTKHRFYLSGHFGGEERWRVNGAIPSVASFREPSTWGTSASLLLALGDHVEAGVHAGVNRLKAVDYAGYSSLVAVGLRFIVTRRKEIR